MSGMYSTRVASVQNVSGETVVLSLDKNASATTLVLREDLSQGQRIAGFVVEIWDDQYGTLRWYQIASGSTIGNQRIVQSPYSYLGEVVRSRVASARQRRGQQQLDNDGLTDTAGANPAGLTGSKWRVRVTAKAGPTRHLASAFRSIEIYSPESGGPNRCFTLGSPTVRV